MSFTSNTLNALKSNSDDWERREVNNDPYDGEFHLDDQSDDDFVTLWEGYRDWMLGGKNSEWRYHKDITTGKLILERR